jgi:hypothetical protein
MYWNSRNSTYSKEGKKIAILCFSHGALIKNFTEAINHGSKTSDSCGYCGITAMSIKNTKSRNEMVFYSDHISQQTSDENNIGDLRKMTEKERKDAEFGYTKQNLNNL